MLRYRESEEGSGQRTVRAELLLLGEIGAGGMANVHLARLRGPLDFERIVAVKRLHASLTADPLFVAMLVDEARVCSAIRHASVVPVLELRVEGTEVQLVLEYVHGDSLARLCPLSGEGYPEGLVAAIAVDVLQALQAVHDARSPKGRALGVVHRDVSPQNVLLGVDGVVRLTDFGIARAASRLQSTAQGQRKGKLGYMAPEQLLEQPVDARADLYACSVVLWELLAGQRLFPSTDPGHVLARATRAVPFENLDTGLDARLVAIVRRGLESDPSSRFHSAWEMAETIESLAIAWPRSRVASWVRANATAELERREEMMTGACPPSSRGAGAFLPGHGDPDATTTGTPLASSSGAPVVSRRAEPWKFGLVGAVLGALLSMVGMVWVGPLRAPSPHPALASATGITNTPSPELAPSALSSGSQSAESMSVPRPVLGAPVSSAARPSAHLPRKALPVPSSPAGPARSGCNPPYTLTPDGVRAYKPDCL